MTYTSSEYHWKTSYDRQHMAGHFLDWENQPNPLKKYSGIPMIPLIPISRFHERSLWDLFAPSLPPTDTKTLNKRRISQILYLAGGITAKSRQAGKNFYFRAGASAGALYPSEIYAGLYTVEDLKPGLYHFGVDDFALTPLRHGNIRRYLNAIIDNSSVDRQPSASFFLTGIFFRSAWKYRARAFRYVLLDTGHLLENLTLALAAEDLALTCHYDFNDENMARLIGLDDQREVGLVCINIFGKPSSAARVSVAQKPPAIDPLPSEIIKASRVSRQEIVYDDMIKIHEAGIPEFVPEESQPTMINDLGVVPAVWVPLKKPNPEDKELPYAQSVLYRRSKRNYINRPLAKDKLMRLLDLICRAPRSDGDIDPFAGLTIGFLSGNINEFEPGFYLLDPEKKQTGKIITGDLVTPMASICLDQKWLANAAIHFLFMTHLKTLDHQVGARGYRHAMLNAGRLGQLIYLGATALGMGCCGIGALYDGEAQTLLGLNRDSALVYLVAAGIVNG